MKKNTILTVSASIVFLVLYYRVTIYPMDTSHPTADAVRPFDA